MTKPAASESSVGKRLRTPTTRDRREAVHRQGDTPVGPRRHGRLRIGEHRDRERVGELRRAEHAGVPRRPRRPPRTRPAGSLLGDRAGPRSPRPRSPARKRAATATARRPEAWVQPPGPGRSARGAENWLPLRSRRACERSSQLPPAQPRNREPGQPAMHAVQAAQSGQGVQSGDVPGHEHRPGACAGRREPEGDRRAQWRRADDLDTDADRGQGRRDRAAADEQHRAVLRAAGPQSTRPWSS